MGGEGAPPTRDQWAPLRALSEAPILAPFGPILGPSLHAQWGLPVGVGLSTRSNFSGTHFQTETAIPPEKFPGPISKPKAPFSRKNSRGTSTKLMAHE